MKKIIKRLLIAIIIIAIAVCGLYFWYRYNQSKKVAQVVPLSNGTAITEYWGDNISSYGQVTSEKSQMGYLPKGAEVQSVNVKEGDHVEAGDVILTVKGEIKDINNKNLEIAKATQQLKVEEIKLNRLLNTKPAPEYVYSQDVTKTISYKSSVEYIAATDDFSFKDETYKTNDKVAVEYYDPTGKPYSMVVYRKTANAVDDDGKPIYYEQTITEDADIALIKEAGDKLTTKTNESSYEFTRSTTYFDSETGKVVGEINYTLDGEVESERKVPDGMNAKELQEAIADEQDAMKKQDLALRKLQYELDTMLNTDDSGQVVAKVSGTVSKVQNQDNYNSNQPFFIITATDNYFITGSIGEFYLKDVNIGDTVTISSWETGSSTEATITSISDTPASDDVSSWSSGNSNVSNYEFKASFDKNSGIEIGSAVDITITPGEQQETGLYIPSYLVRKDSSGSYVMRQNDAGVLEKTYVSVGKTVWGDMIQIKSGITIDDSLAFPYGNGAIEGIKCETTDSFYDYEGGLG